MNPRETILKHAMPVAENVDEPPSHRPSIVLIGRNSRGNWVAQEYSGLFGGLFVDRATAVRYALFENGHHPESLVTVPTELELKMGGTRPSSSTSDHAGSNLNACEQGPGWRDSR